MIILFSILGLIKFTFNNKYLLHNFTFSIHCSIASNDTLSIVEKQSTQAWAPEK